MLIELDPPTCGFAINGLNCDLGDRLRPDENGELGPWGYPLQPDKANPRMRNAASCRDIFLCDVLNWSQKQYVAMINKYLPTYVISITGSTAHEGLRRMATHTELHEDLRASIAELSRALSQYFKDRIEVKVSPVNRGFELDNDRLVVGITLPKEYWGSLVMASWMAAVCRSWLHLKIDNPNTTVVSMWAENNGKQFADSGRFARDEAFAAEGKPYLDMKNFAELVRVVGRHGSPLMNPSLFFNQNTWPHYFQAYFSQSEYLRNLSSNQYRWSHISTGTLGCTSLYNYLLWSGSSASFVKAMVWPAARTWVGFERDLNMKGKPTWLEIVSNVKPAPSAAPEAQIAAETTLRSTQTATVGATPAATAARRVAR